MLASRILNFLMEPDDSLCVDPDEEDEEDEEEDDDEMNEAENDDDEEVEYPRNARSGGSGHDKRRSKPTPRGRGASGRPKRSTAGKSMFIKCIFFAEFIVIFICLHCNYRNDRLCGLF